MSHFHVSYNFSLFKIREKSIMTDFALIGLINFPCQVQRASFQVPTLPVSSEIKQ